MITRWNTTTFRTIHGVTTSAAATVTEGKRVGFDLEAVASRGPGFEELAFGGGERSALEGLEGRTRDRAVTRLWCKKEAIAKGASGGELSRVMLAVEVVFAGADPVPTFVFDEVDAGVGGAVAEVIGRAIADIARHRQVLCITHLPQIAALADTQFVVGKSVN